MLHDKSNGTLIVAIQKALLADEASQDARIDAGQKLIIYPMEGETTPGDVALAESQGYRAMLYDIRDGIAHRLMWKLAMWNAESYVIEIHPFSERDGMFPVCWRYREAEGDNPKNTGHIIWGGMMKDSDGYWQSHQ